uniref:Uncharacterized protein n=1 Tax=Arundo donax TaxID=35708 RepID=A0A0A9GLV0_ARUDO
MSHPSSRASH